MSTALTAFADEVGPDGPVAVEGGLTRWDAAGPLDDGVRVLRAPVGLVEYQPAEMTVRVLAGTTVADLHDELASAGQRTALPDRGGTVGGAVVVGENAPTMLGVGRIREAVLQVTYVSADGRLVVGGGPTVKNVSGFDLPRLFVGSFGTLGLVGEVILRTNPVPAASVWLAADDADPAAVFDTLLRPGAIFHDGARTTVLLEGHAVDVEHQTEQLRSMGTFLPADGPPALPEHRWSVAPSELRRLDTSTTGEYVAAIGVGLLWAARRQPRRAPEPSASEVARRIKAEFDPTRRLNPGRFVAGMEH
ncbi:MAG: FAD-binding protein [Ilumatobacter sp.]|uniref:FAD-binding protein n=1 Tax=Ilumatobacter sp. TaxID=1967498 RepID=UPI0026146916|nr:FAD-binding protein [Ilumatobacter sp.]MDJ0767374.1 FAD-binding protein [Ilumatobacter sp.]